MHKHTHTYTYTCVSKAFTAGRQISQLCDDRQGNERGATKRCMDVVQCSWPKPWSHRMLSSVGPEDKMRKYQDLTPTSWHDAAGLVGVLIAVLPGMPSHAERSFWLALWLGDYYDLARLASCCRALRPSSHVWCQSCKKTQPCTWRSLRYLGITMRIEELVYHAWNNCCHGCAMALRRDGGRYSGYDGARRLACRTRAAQVGWGYSSSELSD